MKKIDLHNYEQFVLDYLEGTLNKDRHAEMEAFLLSHPDIAADVENLCAYELQMTRKEDTLDASFKANLYSDALLEAQKPVYHLQADKSIVFPNKEVLKKRQKPIALWWIRTTAAAILLVFVLWWKPIDSILSNRRQIEAMAVNNIEPIHLRKNQDTHLYTLASANLLPASLTDIENTPKATATTGASQTIRIQITALPPKSITSIQSNNPIFNTKWENELELIFAFQERREHLNSISISTKKRRSIVAIVGSVFWRLTKHHAKQIKNDIWSDSQQLFCFKTPEKEQK